MKHLPTFHFVAGQTLMMRIDVYHAEATCVAVNVNGKKIDLPGIVKSHVLDLNQLDRLRNKWLCIAVALVCHNGPDCHHQTVITLSSDKHEASFALGGSTAALNGMVLENCCIRLKSATTDNDRMKDANK